ncbi:MAG: efflux RND transporter periplasmic adaptor subunit [Bacteroidetes bacterium]|nr:MAG: efflux RND transporter periplasmic adaptor subunit [Bacteroidota bacterium]
MLLKRVFPQSSRYLAAYVFILLSLSLFSCSSGNSGGGGQQGPRTINAEGFKAEVQPYNIQVRATGELHSYEEVELRSPLAGNVLSIHFEEGQHVQQGALLVRIDSRTWEAQKKGLDAQLVFAENELTRRRQLLEVEGASQEDVDQTEARVSSLKAQIDELAVRIDLTYIRAPFSGRLGMRDFSTGAFLSQGDRITRVVQSHKLKINFDIPARYAALAKEDMEVKVISSSLGDTTFARIYALDPVINPNTRSLHLRGIMENGSGKFVPGDFVQVVMDVEQNDNAILIPAESIISELNSQVVYLARNGKAERREVEIGTRTRGRVHILEGIAEGDTVLITGLMDVRDGSSINLMRLNQEAGL